MTLVYAPRCPRRPEETVGSPGAGVPYIEHRPRICFGAGSTFHPVTGAGWGKTFGEGEAAPYLKGVFLFASIEIQLTTGCFNYFPFPAKPHLFPLPKGDRRLPAFWRWGRKASPSSVFLALL